jgi:hypothetical protein
VRLIYFNDAVRKTPCEKGSGESLTMKQEEPKEPLPERMRIWSEKVLTTGRAVMEKEGSINGLFFTYESHPQFPEDEGQFQNGIFKMPDDTDEREFFAGALRTYCHTHPVKAILHVSEAWMVKSKEGTTEEEALKVQPSKHPERQEVVIAMLEMPGKAWGAMMPIQRIAGLVTFPDPQWEKLDKMGGRFGNLLPIKID